MSLRYQYLKQRISKSQDNNQNQRKDSINYQLLENLHNNVSKQHGTNLLGPKRKSQDTKSRMDYTWSKNAYNENPFFAERRSKSRSNILQNLNQKNIGEKSKAVVEAPQIMNQNKFSSVAKSTCQIFETANHKIKAQN